MEKYLSERKKSSLTTSSQFIDVLCIDLKTNHFIFDNLCPS